MKVHYQRNKETTHALLSAMMYCPVPNAVHGIRLMIVPCMHDTHVLDFLVLHMQCVGMHSVGYHVPLHQARPNRRMRRPDRPGWQALNMQLSFFGHGAAFDYLPLTCGYASAASAMSLRRAGVCCENGRNTHCACNCMHARTMFSMIAVAMNISTHVWRKHHGEEHDVDRMFVHICSACAWTQ
jgi:hypothetical protein